jgi:hypothetical protein
MGEEFAKYALDWDTTEPAKYSRWTSDQDYNALVEKLKKLSGLRVAKDQGFADLLRTIEEDAERKKKSSVPLNEEKRFKDYVDSKDLPDEEEKLSNLDGKDPGENEGNADKVDLSRDAYMKEAVNVVCDLVANADELMKKDKISAVQKK